VFLFEFSPKIRCTVGAFRAKMIVLRKVHYILFVADQERSKNFYSSLLDSEPVLHVPGMTEFELFSESILGLMPAGGIKKLLGEAIKDPALASGIPRSELYLLAENAEELHLRALKIGALELSPFQLRNWGDYAGYSLDPDGHVLAIARRG